MAEGTHGLHAASPDLCCEDDAEPVSPKPYRLMSNVDAALVQQVLDVPQRQRIPDVHHHREVDDFRRGLEVAENAGVADADRLAALPVSGKPIFL